MNHRVKLAMDAYEAAKINAASTSQAIKDYAFASNRVFTASQYLLTKAYNKCYYYDNALLFIKAFVGTFVLLTLVASVINFIF